MNDLQPIQGAGLASLASTGRYMRTKSIKGVPRSVVLGLVQAGCVKRDNKKRFRITGRGLAALDGTWRPHRLDPTQHIEGYSCQCVPDTCPRCMVGCIHRGPFLPYVGALGECDSCKRLFHIEPPDD